MPTSYSPRPFAPLCAWGPLWIALLLWLPTMATAATHCRSWDQYPHPGISWTVVSPDGVPSRLFGTVHTDDSRATSLARSATALLQDVKTFVMETELTPGATTRIQRAMRLSSGNLETMIGPRLYARVLGVFASRGWPQTLLEHEQPWALSLILSTPEVHGPVVDQILAQQARADHIPVVGLETTDEQIQALAGFPLATQKALLRAALNQTHESQRLNGLVAAYQKQDLRRLVILSDRQGTDPLDRAFYHRVLHVRNQRMVHRLLPLLRHRRAFVAVGALHLPGFLTGLERAGFCVYPAPVEGRMLSPLSDSGGSP